MTGLTGPAFAQETGPELPPGLAEEVNRDRTGDAVEGRSTSNAAMAQASAAYMVGDYASARMHAERAAAAGEPRGATLAGHIALHGLDGEADEDAAVRWFTRAAERGEPDALIVLSRLAQAERGGLSAWQAGEFLSQAAETGDASAALEYGLHLMESGDPGRAQRTLEWLRLAAEAGHPPAFTEYALALDQWTHGPNDPALALPWYERAAQTGDPHGALQAGLLYLSGEAGTLDEARGADLIETAAEYGLPAAMGQTALLYFQGRGRAADPARAVSWARQGAEAGDAESQFLLAYALAIGEGAPVDRREAYLWALRSGQPGATSLAGDPSRLQLETALERALDPAVAAQVREEAILTAAEF